MKFLKKLLKRKVKKQLVNIPQEIERIYRLNGGKGFNNVHYN